MDAVVLAAGRGERLRPLTDHKPKALLEIGDTPLVGHVLRRLQRFGVRRAIINVCWLGAEIQAALGDGSRYGLKIVYSPEFPALETAGGIRRVLARGLVNSDPFLVHNADVLSDVDLSQTILSPGDDARIVLVPNPPEHPRGDYACREGRVRLDDEENRLTYAGIGFYRQSFFKPWTPESAPLRPLLDKAARANRLAGTVHGGRWWDVGTHRVLAELESDARAGLLDDL